MGIIFWIVFGLIAGLIARWIRPSKKVKGFVGTLLLGVSGSVVGGLISTMLGYGRVDGFNLSSFFVAVVGAIVALFIYDRLLDRSER